jgi:hypothetical protein
MVEDGGAVELLLEELVGLGVYLAVEGDDRVEGELEVVAGEVGAQGVHGFRAGEALAGDQLAGVLLADEALLLALHYFWGEHLNHFVFDPV